MTTIENEDALRDRLLYCGKEISGMHSCPPPVLVEKSRETLICHFGPDISLTSVVFICGQTGKEVNSSDVTVQNEDDQFVVKYRVRNGKFDFEYSISLDKCDDEVTWCSGLAPEYDGRVKY